MRRIIIIQARMTSERLYGKVMLPMYKHRPTIDVMLWRIRQAAWLKYGDICVATTNDGTEAPIIESCDGFGGAYTHRGATSDVLNRFYTAAKMMEAKSSDIITRLTADCPFVCIDVIEAVWQQFAGDYTANTIERTFPRGLDVECFPFEVLEHLEHSTPKDDVVGREHVTYNILKNADFKKQSVVSPFRDPQDHYRLTVDTPEDYRTCYALYQKIDKLKFDYKFLHDFINNNEKDWVFNKKINQKEVG
jgi:spore coat polysaccharide biosynthesis protein SpsF